MRITRPDRRVITFYSFKGGVGRTMALANVAFRLADVHALNVIAVDWDLEAPGLHTFFGVDSKALAKARGVLDYFEEWSGALERGDASPPQVGSWLLRISEGAVKPRHGALRLLVAGRQDEAYGSRLGRLNWQELYASRGGAAAVEVLRKQLVEDADVVLVDSRTGFTDVGGICTVQLPDAVVLMTTPNRQSLEGIERVARAIAGANSEERAGRARQQVWLSVARVPIVEETALAKEWFKEHAARFEEGANARLWRRDDHPRGLETFTIPQRSRWVFAEKLVVVGELVEPEEPLFIAYGRLTLALLEWAVGMHDIAFSTSAASPPNEQHIEALRSLARKAELRNDMVGVLSALIQLGEVLAIAGKHEDALKILEQARTFALGREARRDVAYIDALMGVVLKAQGNDVEAMNRWRDASALARATGYEFVAGTAEFFLGAGLLRLGKHEEGQRLLSSAVDHLRRADENWRIPAMRMTATAEHLMLQSREFVGLKMEKSKLLRSLLSIMRAKGLRQQEAQVIHELLAMRDEGFPLDDEEAMLHRLREIEAEEHASAKVTNAAPKPRSARSTRKRRPKL